MTLELLVRQFTSLEINLKDILRSSVSLYNVYLMENKSLFAQDNVYSQRIIRALQSVAPYGLRGIEEDHYYIIRLLLEGSSSIILDDNQRKQWNVLTDEIYTLLSFFGVPLSTVADMSLYLTASTRYINRPVSIFFANKEPMSNNTFARLISATVHFIIITYILTLTHCVKFVNPPENPPNSNNSESSVPVK